MVDFHPTAKKNGRSTKRTGVPRSNRTRLRMRHNDLTGQAKNRRSIRDMQEKLTDALLRISELEKEVLALKHHLSRKQDD
jgi:hypothetical protein